MSRRGNNGSKLSGVPAKLGGSNASSPAAATPPTAIPPSPTVPRWSGCGDSSGQSSSPQSATPWGGYFNYLRQPHLAPPQLLGENFHFVGAADNLNPPSPSPAPFAKGTPTQKVSIDIDGDDCVEASRPVKKRYRSHGEEERLASGWLNISKDPIHGNDKKSDSFWGQITEEFNKNTQPDRSRDTNQLKIHWTRLSKIINEFNGYWSSVCKMNKSGYSDDQLMDEAQQLFQKKNGKPFTLVHWWKILKNEPKWCSYVAQSEKEKEKWCSHVFHLQLSHVKLSGSNVNVNLLGN